MPHVKHYTRTHLPTGKVSVLPFTQGQYPALTDEGVPLSKALSLLEMWNRPEPELWSYHITMPVPTVTV